MFEIKIAVKGNGTLTFGNGERLRLGTSGENQRIKLVFDIDDTVEGTYQYIKFMNKKVTYLYRVYSKAIVLSKNIQAYDGVWRVSFISTNAGIVNNQITGTYAFITEPIEAIVVKGILDENYPTDEETALINLCSMSFTRLVIPDSVPSISAYFLYNSKRTFELSIGSGVKTIGGYAFYDAVISKIEFNKESELTTLEANSLYHMTFNCDIKFPKSLVNWNSEVLKNSTVNKVSFEDESKLRTLNAYSFREVNVNEIELPHGLQVINSNAIKNCTTLTRLWIPNTINTAIPHTAIAGCTLLTNVELETDFNIDAYFDNCTLTAESMIQMLYTLKNRRSVTAGKLILGATNLAKLTTEQKAIAVNKNWTLS